MRNNRCARQQDNKSAENDDEAFSPIAAWRMNCATNLASVSCVLFAFLFLMTNIAFAQITFEGQTVRLSVASSTGGPTDLLTRQFAPFIAKHLPGKPTVIVENRPGAGGAVGANYIYSVAKPDGLSIGCLFGAVTQGLIGGDGIRFDPAKFQWLGAVSQTQVLLATSDLKLTTFRDLLKPAKPLVLASVGTNSAPDMANRLFLEMIGAKYAFVSGYPGQAETMMALGRKEASLANAGHTVYLPRRDAIRREGLYDAIVQRGEYFPDGTFHRNKQMADLVTTVEAIEEINPLSLKGVDFSTYRSVVGSFAVHFSLVLPPETPTALVSAMRQSVAMALNDPDARAIVSTSLRVDYDFVDGEASQRIVNKLREEFLSDSRIANRLKQLMTVN